MDAKSSPVWCSPVWQFDTGFDHAFNERLQDEMYQIGVQMRTATHIPTSLWDFEGECLHQLQDKIIELARTQILPSIQEASDLNIDLEYSAAWGNVKEPGEAIEAHAHHDCSLVATYYVKASEGCGDLVLLDTSSAFTPDRGLFATRGITTLPHNHITPRAGLVVFFPAYVLHQVNENRSRDLRISISADMRQVVDYTVPNALAMRSFAQSFQKVRG